MVLAQGADGGSGGGVAGDDQHAAALCNQVFANSNNPAADKVVGLVAVGHMGCVGKVEQVSAGQRASNCREDREAAEAAVEDANHWVDRGAFEFGVIMASERKWKNKSAPISFIGNCLFRNVSIRLRKRGVVQWEPSLNFPLKFSA